MYVKTKDNKDKELGNWYQDGNGHLVEDRPVLGWIHRMLSVLSILILVKCSVSIWTRRLSLDDQ